jgi:serine/threonine protein kinase
MKLDDFKNVRKLAEGTNANIYYLGELWDKEVVFKIIKKTAVLNPHVNREFDFERLILERTDHPNVIKILGAGMEPRNFIVLEYLNNGTLGELLVKNQSQSRLTRAFFPKVTFPWPELLARSRYGCIHTRIFYRARTPSYFTLTKPISALTLLTAERGYCSY